MRGEAGGARRAPQTGQDRQAVVLRFSSRQSDFLPGVFLPNKPWMDMCYTLAHCRPLTGVQILSLRIYEKDEGSPEYIYGLMLL